MRRFNVNETVGSRWEYVSYRQKNVRFQYWLSNIIPMSITLSLAQLLLPIIALFRTSCRYFIECHPNERKHIVSLTSFRPQLCALFYSHVLFLTIHNKLLLLCSSFSSIILFVFFYSRCFPQHATERNPTIQNADCEI